MPTTTIDNPHPKTFISVGRTRPVIISMTNALRPQLTFPAVLDLEDYTPSAVRLLLKTVNPRPEGVIVGGGVSEEVQDEVERTVRDWERESGERVAVVRVPLNMKDREGPEATLRVVKEEIRRVCGVEW